MKRYITPETEINSIQTDGLLYTASPEIGGDGTGLIPEAKPVELFPEEEWEDEEEESEVLYRHRNIWED